MMTTRRVAITGHGMICGLGHNSEEIWSRTLEGQCGIDKIQLFDASNIPVQIAAEVKDFQVSPEILEYKESQRSSRFVKMATVAAYEAMQKTGDHACPPELFGCAIGVGIGAIQDIESAALTMKEKGYKRVSPFFIPYTIPNMAAGCVSNRFNLQGPNICTTTACASGTHAIGEAFMYIKLGLADMMLAGGAEAPFGPVAVVGFTNMKALCAENDNPKGASRPFDASRNGFVMGEGAGLLVLEEWDRAVKRGATIYAEMVGFGMSGDAYHITTPAPEGRGAQACMRAALKSGTIPSDEVDYINAHGTSTKFNDLNESLAVARVFGPQAKNISISSTKGATGHCLGAAGGIEAVYTALSLHQQICPQTLNLKNIDPEIPELDFVMGTPKEKRLRYALSNSFGFGGTNASIAMRAVHMK